MKHTQASVKKQLEENDEKIQHITEKLLTTNEETNDSMKNLGTNFSSLNQKTTKQSTITL